VRATAVVALQVVVQRGASNGAAAICSGVPLGGAQLGSASTMRREPGERGTSWSVS
jgi:hypothetical protein